MRLLATSEEVCQTLAHEKFIRLGNQYSFREYDVLESKYFLYIFGLGRDICTSNIASALYAMRGKFSMGNYRKAVR